MEMQLGGLSTEEIERLENYYIWEAERLMAFGVQEKKGTFRGYVETLAYRGKPITQFTISVGRIVFQYYIVVLCIM